MVIKVDEKKREQGRKRDGRKIRKKSYYDRWKKNSVVSIYIMLFTFVFLYRSLKNYKIKINKPKEKKWDHS